MIRTFAALLLALCPVLLSAHAEWKEANCLGVVDADGRLEITLKFDVPSYLVGQPPQDAAVKAMDELLASRERLTSAVTAGRETFLRDTRLIVDGREVPLRLESFPAAEQIAATSSKQGLADRFPVMLNARLAADLPRPARNLVLHFPALLGKVFVNLRDGMSYQVVTTATPTEPAELGLTAPAKPSAVATGRALFVDGFAHVIPSGWDHCLFMLAMFLGASSVGEAMRRSVVFTLGHSITLTAVACGWLGAPGPWVEPFIALTIGVSAWLAYRGSLGTSTSLLIPAAFGLVHGLGFAAAVTDSLQGWLTGDILAILVGFNLGVEAAQASVIVVAAGIFWALRRTPLEPRFCRRCLSLTVALIGFAVCAWRLWELR